VLGLAGLAGTALAFVHWSGLPASDVDYDAMLRLVLPSVTALVISCQLLLGTFFLSILFIRRSGHEPGSARILWESQQSRVLKAPAEPALQPAERASQRLPA
jgi:hypothetical protein